MTAQDAEEEEAEMDPSSSEECDQGVSRPKEPGADQDKKKDTIRGEHREGKCIRDIILGKDEVASGRDGTPALFKKSPFRQKRLLDGGNSERRFGLLLSRNLPSCTLNL